VSEYEESQVVKVKKVVKKVPTRSWVFGVVSFVALIFSVILQRIVTLAPAGSKVSTLFLYQSLSTTLSWTFIISGAAAVFTGLTYVHHKELVARLNSAQKNLLASKASQPAVVVTPSQANQEGHQEPHQD